MTPEQQAPAPVRVEARKTFPLLGGGGAGVDWQLVQEHAGQARTNHGQTLEGLARRGGLSWCELYAVLHERRWQKMDSNDAMIACRALEARYLAALEAPDAAPAWLTNCAVCGRIVDTREKAEGGDGHGCEYPNGWTCSSDCAGKLNPDPDWMQESLAALEAHDAGVVAELVGALRKLTKCQTIGDINSSIDAAHAALAKWDAK